MWKWPGASQAGDSFCWAGTAWASQAGAPPPPPKQAGRTAQADALQSAVRATGSAGAGLGGPPAAPLLPQSRSGAAALSAHRAAAAAAATGTADPFDFHDALPGGPLASKQQHGGAGAGGSWRGRGSSFLLGAGAAAASAPQPPATVAPGPATAGRTHAWTQSAARSAPAPTVQQHAAHAASGRPAHKPPGPTAATQAQGPAPSAAGAAQPAPQAPAAAPLPAGAVSLSLERYLEFWQLLTKGTGQLQPLSELEKSILKAADLKQILLVNGLNASSRTKKEMQDRMGPLCLFSPLCLLPDVAAVPTGARPASPQLPDADAMGALGWLAPEPDVGAPLAGGAAPASCCPLPPVRIRLPGGEVVESMQGAAGGGTSCQQQHHQHPQQQQQAHQLPADSQVTEASAGALARMQCAIQDTPEVHRAAAPMLQPGGQAGSVSQHPPEVPEAEAGESEAEAPEWLVQGVAAVAERSQGSADAACGKQLLGRRVAFVLLEDFGQDDARGITDTVEAGVLEGQVVEPVGVDHDEDCPAGCTETHAFHYVRVPATSSTAPPARRAGRRLDLVVDLRAGLRRHELEELLLLGDDELQDAWVLLEPRPEPEEEQEAQQAGRQAAAPAPAAGGGGGWRAKRSAAGGPAPGSAAKRQHAGA